MPARSSAALIATPPRSAALKSFSEPRSRPIGVRAPLTMTERDMLPPVRAADVGGHVVGGRRARRVNKRGAGPLAKDRTAIRRLAASELWPRSRRRGEPLHLGLPAALRTGRMPA